MDFANNFIHHGNVDVAGLRQRLSLAAERQWYTMTMRQEHYVEHKDTQCLPLVYDLDFRHTNPTRWPFYFELEPWLLPVLDQVRALVEGGARLVRLLLTRLPAGAKIPSHRDSGFSLSSSRRLHIPLETNPDVDFVVDGEKLNLRVGEVWEINNMRRHGVTNRGSSARVHLISDWSDH